MSGSGTIIAVSLHVITVTVVALSKKSPRNF
jgi:hypothetical protein